MKKPQMNANGDFRWMFQWMKKGRHCVCTVSSSVAWHDPTAQALGPATGRLTALLKPLRACPGRSWAMLDVKVEHLGKMRWHAEQVPCTWVDDAEAGARSEGCAHGEGGPSGPRGDGLVPHDGQHDPLPEVRSEDVGGDGNAREGVDEELDGLGEASDHGLHRSKQLLQVSLRIGTGARPGASRGRWTTG